MNIQITEEHLESLNNVLDLLESGDPAHSHHPHHRNFLKHTANHGGLTPNRYPALYAAIDAEPANSAMSLATEPPSVSGFCDREDIVFVATQRDTHKLAARVMLTRLQPVAMMMLNVFVAQKTAEGGTVVLAHGQTTEVCSQTVTVNTDPSTALTVAPGTKVTVLMSWVINYQNGETKTGSCSVTRTVKASTDPIITAPVQRPDRTTGDLNNIVIGLARGLSQLGRNQDVDYWFWQNEVTDSRLLVPLSGSIRLKKRVAEVGINNPILDFSLTLSEGGSSGIIENDAQQYCQYFQRDLTDESGRTVLFTMVAPAQGVGTAIDFGQSPWASDTRCFFTARLTFAYDDLSGTEDVTITSSVEGDDDPVDGVAHIKPLVYVWHCLAAGTQILLADGTTKAVELIDNRDTVVSGGGNRNVLATLAQPHHGPVTVLSFANGASLTVSGTHPLITPAGAVQASSLKVGDQVLVAGGDHTTVQAIKEERFAGQVLYNLWLDPQLEGETSMVANGLVVGDHLTQGRLLREAATDPVKVRARLPASLHMDYTSWLEDRAARG